MNTTNNQRPLRIVNSVAPIRICDNGGWTDTWFAEHGKIFNIAVYPYAEAQIEVYPIDAMEDRIVIYAENFGERYVAHSDGQGYDRHPLLEAAIQYMHLPDDLAFQVTIHSDAPVGASTGTSAAVSVALIGALDRLTPGRMSPHEVAYTAQRIETEMLGQQCGIQDQLSSAFGGINYIEMFGYPHATVSQIFIPDRIWWELERRLILIYLGKSHSSSDVHRRVIADLENEGPDSVKINDLRKTAEVSRDAVYAGDFTAFGRAMTDNTEAQGRLHADLISDDAERIFEIAREYGALGWKLNGAGGEGGSVTLLSDSISHHRRAMRRAIEEANPLYRDIPIHLSRFGLRTWETVSG